MYFYITYCPVCGYGVESQGGEQINCPHCNSEIEVAESEYTYDYYIDKAKEIYNNGFKSFEVLAETEIYSNPLFNQELHDKVKEEKSKPKPQTIEVSDETYIPKCPVCQSPNIKKLSATNRGLHLIAVGVASKTARSQFVCRNCGYKF